MLRDGKVILDLADGLQLRRVRTMGDHRIELLNADSDAWRDDHGRIATEPTLLDVISIAFKRVVLGV